ncbi:trypsin-like peptidase domain-containing protein [Cellulomonas aerilata]|uniref:Protease n=1 Tax=Cellulomonas aerilata TaxID=515326 RepID=A0A512DE28_9CELL|nr:trypsin-like peptidase domain-containing protein [Cellulomonas aerilata]GEO34724.1 protease [Cellulomonas aerilata]
MTTPQHDGFQPDVPQPGAPQPEMAQPEVAQPEAVQPEVAQPAAVQPEVAQPNPFAPPSTSYHAAPPAGAAPRAPWPATHGGSPSSAPPSSAPPSSAPQQAGPPAFARPHVAPREPFGQPHAGPAPYGRPDAGANPYVRQDRQDESGPSPFVRRDESGPSPYARPHESGPSPYARPHESGASPYARPDTTAPAGYERPSPYAGPGTDRVAADNPAPTVEGARSSDSWWNATTPWPPPGLEPDPAPARPPRRRRSLSVAWVVPLVLVSLLAGALGGVLADGVRDEGRPADAALPVSVSPDSEPRSATSVAGLAASVLPSVVSIEVTTSTGAATGSGFVLRDDGYLLTNNHVIAGGVEPGSRIAVTFSDGSEEDATIVGRTGDYDLAVLKVERTGLAPLALADSDEVAVGDPVVAIGAPLGLVGTVTTGIVSARNRPVAAGQASETAFINAIQTDAAINPGNSGGPLVNAAAEVVGINSAIAQPPGGQGASGSIGLGFAIPANQARRTAEQLIETGTATYPIIGVLLEQGYQGEGVQVALAAQNGTPAVTEGGPAANAGIRPGDVIVAIDGRPVTDPDELIVSIRAKAPGDATVLRVRSGDDEADERDVRVVLDEATSD